MSAEMVMKSPCTVINEQEANTQVRICPSLMTTAKSSHACRTLFRNLSTEPLLAGFVLLTRAMTAALEVPMAETSKKDIGSDSIHTGVSLKTLLSGDYSSTEPSMVHHPLYGVTLNPL